MKEKEKSLGGLRVVIGSYPDREPPLPHLILISSVEGSEHYHELSADKALELATTLVHWARKQMAGEASA